MTETTPNTPTPRPCAACERETTELPVRTKAHGLTTLCADCREYCDSRGWLVA